MQKTVVGAFDRYAAAQGVVRDLQADGFMARNVSIVVREPDAAPRLRKPRRIRMNRAVPPPAQRRAGS